jgi:hypothetical protein
MKNHRQLTLGIHADDNQEKFANARGWLTGGVDFSPNRSNWDPAADIMKSPPGRIAATRRHLQMPGDRSIVRVGGKTMPRIRSMAMNNWVGGEIRLSLEIIPKKTDILNPVRTYVLRMSARTALTMATLPSMEGHPTHQAMEILIIQPVITTGQGFLARPFGNQRWLMPARCRV